MSLDHFVRCPIPGCEWEITYGAPRCYQHRGPGLPQYRMDSEGAILETKFFRLEDQPDYNPDGSYTAA